MRTPVREHWKVRLEHPLTQHSQCQGPTPGGSHMVSKAGMEKDGQFRIVRRGGELEGIGVCVCHCKMDECHMEETLGRIK